MPLPFLQFVISGLLVFRRRNRVSQGNYDKFMRHTVARLIDKTMVRKFHWMTSPNLTCHLIHHLIISRTFVESMAAPMKRPIATAICASTRTVSRSLLLPASYRCFSVLNRPQPNYEGHIPLTQIERLGLAFGSGLMSFIDPRRGGENSRLPE